MKNLSWCMSVLLTLGFGLIAEKNLQAACPPSALQVPVLPGAVTTFVPKSALALSPGTLQTTTPLHGTLTDGGDRFIFTPNRSFWDLGVDSIVVTTPGRNDPPKTVLWIAATRHGELSVENFENPGNPNWDLGSFDPAAISPLGRLSGNYGLRFTATPYGGSTSATVPGESIRNGATAGGGAEASWHPPGGGGITPGSECGGMTGIPCPTGEWHLFLQADGDNDGQIEHSVFLRETDMTVEVGLTGGNSLAPGADPDVFTSVSRTSHHLELVHWPTADGRIAGAALWIDGRQELAIETGGRNWPLEQSRSEFTFNEVPATFTPGATLANLFDNLAVFQVPAERRFECVGLDGFDNGALDPVWSLINPSNLTVQGGAALVGPNGLDVGLSVVGANTGALLTLGIDNRERHGLRLRFDPNTVEIEPGASVNLAFGLQPVTAPKPFLAMLRRNGSGSLLLQIQSRDDLGNTRTTPIAISDAPHVLELDWKHSVTTYVATGYLRVWLDGVQVAEHRNLDNDGQSISEIRFGTYGTAGAAKGHVFLDQVEIWQEARPGI